MMNFSRKLNLALLLSSLFLANSAKAETPLLEFDSSAPSALTHELGQSGAELWRNWESDFKVKLQQSRIRIGFARSLQTPNGERIFAKTDENQISIDSQLNQDQLVSVFHHELAHSFLFKACPAKTPSGFFSESFALWISGDEKRLVRENAKDSEPFHLSSKAREYLLSHLDRGAIALSFHHSLPAKALARVIADVRQTPKKDQSLKEYFQSSISNCELIDTKLIEHLLDTNLDAAALSAESFLFMDGISGEVLTTKGSVDSLFPAASVLKPYLLSAIPQIQLPLMSEQKQEWYCPQYLGRKLWTWEEALRRSCNGFFLSHPEPNQKEWARWQEPLEKLGVKIQSSNANLTLSQAIGLVPGVEASPRSIADTFRYLAHKNPEVIEALRDTAKNGTLENLPDSSWFVSQKIALKSGTIRNGKLQPEHGWIVAIGPFVKSKEPQVKTLGASDRTKAKANVTTYPSFIAVIHQKGSSPQILLSRLRAHLQEHTLINHLTRVQILGLTPQASLKFSCAGVWQNDRASQTSGNIQNEDLLALDLSEGDRVQCIGKPLVARFPNHQGEWMEREYHGTVHVSSPPATEQESLTPVSGRQARARTGSRFILETSEQHYLLKSLASEFPNGRRETMKALALTLKFNSRNSRHSQRPVCDTTHCQVFGSGSDDLANTKKIELRKIISEIEHQSLVVKNQSPKAAPPWLHFSLGGRKTWQEERTAQVIERALQLPQPLSEWQRERENITLQLGTSGRGIVLKKNCEWIRNILKLPSCPDRVSLNKAADKWVFRGQGEGHGLGLDLETAELMALEGRSHLDILRAFYPETGLQTER